MTINILTVTAFSRAAIAGMSVPAAVGYQVGLYTLLLSLLLMAFMGAPFGVKTVVGIILLVTAIIVLQ